MYPQAPPTVTPHLESLAQPITFIVLSAIGMAAVLVVTAVLLLRRRHLGVSLTAAVILLMVGVIGVGSGASWFERTVNSNRSLTAKTAFENFKNDSKYSAELMTYFEQKYHVQTNPGSLRAFKERKLVYSNLIVTGIQDGREVTLYFVPKDSASGEPELVAKRIGKEAFASRDEEGTLELYRGGKLVGRLPPN